MKRDIQEILDECVESMINGKATLDECIHRLDKGLRSEVEPMLFAVNRIVSDADVKPDQQRKAAGKDRLLAAVEQKRWESGIERAALLTGPTRMEMRKKSPRRLMMRLALVTGFMMALSSVTVAMANESLPGSPLYPVKRAVENAKIGLTFDEGNKKLLYMQVAENRMEELEKLDGDDENYPEVLEDMNESLEKATTQNAIQATSVESNENSKENNAEGNVQYIDDNGNVKLSEEDAKLAQIEKRLNAIKERSALLAAKLETASPDRRIKIERKLERLEQIAIKKAEKKSGESDSENEQNNNVENTTLEERREIRKSLSNNNAANVNNSSGSAITATKETEASRDSKDIENKDDNDSDASTSNSTEANVVKKININKNQNRALKKKLLENGTAPTTTVTLNTVTTKKRPATNPVSTTNTTQVNADNEKDKLTVEERQALKEQKKKEIQERRSRQVDGANEDNPENEQ
ncbi:MAG: hypothetical protein HY779_02605 [Rubrobacteridae bacterium]|nr:hypothetical protein [Rubrobacteridae bacterium]